MTSNPSGGLKRGDTQKISGSREDAMGTMLAAATEPDLPVHGRCTDVMVAALEAEGIEYCFGIPGEENLDFLDSLRTAKSLKLVLTRHVLAHLEAQHGVEDWDRPVERPADVERPNGRPGARAVVVRRRHEALYFVEVRTVPAAAGAEVANRRRPRPAAARHEVLRERRCQAPVQAGIPGLGAEACVRRTRSRHCLRSLTRRVTLMRHRADAVAATASVRATSRHCSDGALSDTPRRPRRGPKRLKIER